MCKKLGTGGCGAVWEPVVGTAGVESLKNKEPGKEAGGLIRAWMLQIFEGFGCCRKEFIFYPVAGWGWSFQWERLIKYTY